MALRPADTRYHRNPKSRQGETEKDDVDSALTQALQPRFEPIDMFYFESAIRDRQRLAH